MEEILGNNLNELHIFYILVLIINKGNYTRAREIFERWMSWRPEEKGWLCYIKFEERMGEHDKCREIMYRYLV